MRAENVCGTILILDKQTILKISSKVMAFTRMEVIIQNKWIHMFVEKIDHACWFRYFQM